MSSSKNSSHILSFATSKCSSSYCYYTTLYYILMSDANFIRMSCSDLFSCALCLFKLKVVLCWLSPAAVRILFTCLSCVKLHSPDVRAFLLMEKREQISDASEDEDEKVCSSLQQFWMMVCLS